jgi:hypothetical protein
LHGAQAEFSSGAASNSLARFLVVISRFLKSKIDDGFVSVFSAAPWSELHDYIHDVLALCMMRIVPLALIQ